MCQANRAAGIIAGMPSTKICNAFSFNSRSGCWLKTSPGKGPPYGNPSGDHSAILPTDAAPKMMTVPLKNAALSGVDMPVVGIGTGSYVNNKTGNPTCWSCPNRTYDAVLNWLRLGGRRIDTALCYHTQDQVGRAIKDSRIPRSEIFVTSKLATCNGSVQGYNETLAQHVQNLEELQLDYVDLLLVHWPGPPIASLTNEPACLKPDADGRWGGCRRTTWRAMIELLNMGYKNGTRAIGVSNFEHDHLMDLMPVGGAAMMPSVGQNEYHPYWHESDLRQLDDSMGIQNNGYSPLGTPDVSTKWNISIFTDPVINDIATKHNISAAQVVLRWEIQNGVVVNPRSGSTQHQLENIAVGLSDFYTLTTAEMNQIDQIHPNPRAPPIRKVCPDPLPLK